MAKACSRWMMGNKELTNVGLSAKNRWVAIYILYLVYVYHSRLILPLWRCCACNYPLLVISTIWVLGLYRCKLLAP